MTVLVTLLGVAMTLASIGLASNVKMGWVTSPAGVLNLFGGAPQAGALKTGTVKPGPALPSTGPGPVPGDDRTGPRLPASLAPATDPAWNLTPTPSGNNDGELITTWTSPDTGMRRKLIVWLPPDFNRETTYDVVVFLHGYPGSVYSLSQLLDLKTTIPALVAAGKIRPTILVAPDLGSDLGPPACLNFESLDPWETWVVSDTVKALRTTYPNTTDAVAGWTIAGVSSGGYCAANLSMRYPDRFGSAIVLSAYDAPLVGALALADSQTRADNTISNMVAQAGGGVNLYVFGSRTDPDSAQLAQAVRAAAAPGANIGASLVAGAGHAWSTWRNALRPALTWWGETVSNRPATEPTPGGGNGSR